MPTLHRIASTMRDAILMRPARVVVLSVVSGPSHIARFVVSIVVNAVKRQIRRWTSANISDERGKTVTPAVAYLNTAGTIVAVVATRRVVAPLNHRSPNGMFGRIAHAVFPACLSAAARLRRSSSQAPDEHVALSATRAATFQMPQRPVSPRCLRENGPLSDDGSRSNWSVEHSLRISPQLGE